MDASVETPDQTKLEDLPAELFHLIFDYLTGDHILRSFLPLNHRFNSLIKTLHFNTIDFSTWTCREITDFFKNSFYQISTSHLSFKLSNQISQSNSCSACIEFIFSSLLDLHQLKYLLNHLQQLIFIRPIIDSTICLPDLLLQSFLIYASNKKIIFRKKPFPQRFESVIICSNEMLRTVLVDHGEISNRILIHFQNPFITSIIPFIRHLKLHIDNYQQQWTNMSAMIHENLSEFSLLIFDHKFELYDGGSFSSLLNYLPTNCHLHFYLQVLPNQMLSRRNFEMLFQSFQTEFYQIHQANVTIAYCRNYHPTDDCPILIYTSPFCASKLPLINNHEMIGTCSDYTNLTQLILDPCTADYANMFTPINPMNLPSNLTSLEFLHTPSHRLNQMIVSINIILQQISSRLRHIHFRSLECSLFLRKRIFPLYTFQYLRYLDITDTDEHSSILSDILREEQFCRNIFHLNISGLCRLKISHIKDLSRMFSNLQTLQFSMKLNSSYNEQLNTIGQCLLIQMRFHLHYLHIHFEQENLLIMSMTPSESQLSEWLGYNQKRLLHVQAIELNRNELSAWM